MASILTNTAAAAVGRGVNVALGVVILSLISRFLGAAEYGVYVLLLSYGALLQVGADLGLYLTLSRVIASRSPTQENFYASHITALRLLLLLVVFGAGWAATLMIPSLRGVAAVYPLVALGYSAQSLSQLMMSVYQKHGTVWRASGGDLAGRTVQLAGIIIIGAANATLASMTALFTVGLAAAAYLHRRFLPPHINLKPSFAWNVWRRLAASSWPWGAVLVFNAVYFRLDTVILSLYHPTEQVGLYGLAYRLVESTLFLPAMFGGLMLPRLAAAWNEGRLFSFRQYAAQGMAAVAWAAVLAVLTAAMLAGAIIELISGSAYADAAPLLSILSVAMGLMFVGNFTGFSLVAAGRRRTLLVIAAGLAAANTILNFIFIPVYGAAAAAWTTVLTELAAAGVSVAVLLRLKALVVSPVYLLRLAAAGSVLAAVYATIPASWPVLVTIFLGAAAYLAAGVLTRLVTRKNISLLTERRTL